MYKVRLICIVIRGSLTGQRYVDEVLHPHVLQIYLTVGNNFLFQYGKELFASWSCHTPLTGLQGPDPSQISHRCDILGRRIHDPIPSQLPNFPDLNTSWLNNDNVFHKGWGVQPQTSFKHAQRLIECIHKGGGHTRYDLQYINL